MDKVIVLPCSEYQKDLIAFLKNKGNKVVGVNPIRNSTTDLVDVLIEKDIYDTEGIYSQVRNLNVTSVFTDQSDVAVLPAMFLARKLNLRHNNKESLDRFSCDKSKMYDHFKTSGFDVLDYEIVKDKGQITIDYPFVLKPIDSANSRGVYKVEREEDLDFCFDNSIKFSRNKTLVAQKWCDSKFQIICDGICIGGKHHTIASAYKGPYLATAITSFVRWPLSEKLDQKQLNEIYELNDDAVHSTGVDFCLTHAEYIIDKDVVYLNEIACRGGGFKISSQIASWVSGVNLYEILYDYVIDSKPYVPLDVLSRSAIIQFYTELPSSNLDKFQIMNDFIKNDFNPRKCCLVATAEDKNCLDEKLNEAKRCF